MAAHPASRNALRLAAALLVALLLHGCEQGDGEGAAPAGPAVAPVTSAVEAGATALAEDPSDDGIADAPEPYATAMAGAWVPWEDTEGGVVCPLTLFDTPVLGGYALDIAPACVAELELEGEMYAWFIDPRDGSLVLADAARQPVARLPHERDRVFYRQRSATRPYGLMLEPAN
jgi:hypothetical protein